MKKIYRLFIAIGFIMAIPSLNSFSQVRINTDGSSPDPSAMLDVKSTIKGIVLPRMTASQRTAIPSAAIGLLVYQTDPPAGFYYYTGTGWMYIGKGEGGGGHMIDEDGNAYPTVKIGNQEWMAENLRVTHYRNGDIIPNEIDDLLWSSLTTGAFCWFNNDPALYKAYGGLYNQYAVTDSRKICPVGWHVPRDAEWATLTNYLGGETVAGGKMKAAVEWTAPNTGATNTSSFSAFPYGYRGSNGLFYGFYFYGNWWTATTYQTNSALYRYLFQNDATAYHNYYNKAGGFSVRCMKDSDPVLELSTVMTNSATNITFYTVTSGGNVISDGGAPVTARGVCWSISSNPTIGDSHTTDGSGTGMFVSSLTGLAHGTLYYVRAYATNSVGTSYGNQESFTTLAPWSCGSSMTINHITGTVAPVSKTVVYGTVTNVPGEPTKCWITSNLGADHQATAVNDATEASAGWYWQFNHKQGYKMADDGVTRTPNTTWINPISENLDWQTANDPCTIELGSGWRIPTSIEWTNVDASGNWTDWTGLWNSALKMHAAGLLGEITGGLSVRGGFGMYWSSSQYDPGYGRFLFFNNSNSNMYMYTKAYGFTLRCIRNLQLTVTTSAVTNVTSTTAIGGGNVTYDGGIPVTARGVCWNTSPNPTLANSYTTDGNGTGSFVSNLSNLSSGTLYYVRAYATNSGGNSYGNEVSFTTLVNCGTSITINHVAGPVAPVSKTITYGIVTNIPGEPLKCWITSNLGADHQAISIDDATEPSAGWYWKFNRKQGYKNDGTTLTPSWPSYSITESSNWTITEDPCALELGAGWRIPTNTEWTNVDAGGNWIDWNGPWNSGLKLHAAGLLGGTTGSLLYRGSYGNYWSSIQNSSIDARYLGFSISSCSVDAYYKDYGFSVRCLK